MKICKNYDEYVDYKAMIQTDGAYCHTFEYPTDYPCIVSFDVAEFRLDGSISNPVIRRRLVQNNIYIKDLKGLIYRDDFETLIKKD